MPTAFTTTDLWSVRVGPSGQSVLWAEQDPFALWAFSPAGAALWSTSSSMVSESGSTYGGGFVVDDHDTPRPRSSSAGRSRTVRSRPS